MVTKTKQKPFTLAEGKIIGEKLGMDWTVFDLKEFCLGLNTERTQGAYNPVTNFASDDPILIGKIVRAHLTKTPDYYTQWAAQEQEAALARQNSIGGTRGKKFNHPKKLEQLFEKKQLIAQQIAPVKNPQHPFEVGKLYQNREGDYHVISITDPNMVIRYRDGRQIESSIALQVRIWENLQENEVNDLTVDFL